MAPSTPGFPEPRASAQRPAGRREYESYDNAESAFITLAASTVFQEVITFGGRPESIIIDASAAAIEVRFSNRGQAPRAPVRLQHAGETRFQVAAEIVEARDPAGAGGQLVTAIGRYASGGIDVRNNFGGPSRERPSLPDESRATQIDTTE